MRKLCWSNRCAACEEPSGDRISIDCSKNWDDPSTAMVSKCCCLWKKRVTEAITGAEDYSAPSQGCQLVRCVNAGQQLTSLERKGRRRSQAKREKMYFGALIHFLALHGPRTKSLAPSYRSHVCFRIIIIMRDEKVWRSRRIRC